MNLPTDFPGRQALLYVVKKYGIQLKTWGGRMWSLRQEQGDDSYSLRLRTKTIHQSPGFHAIDIENHVLYLETQPLYPDSYYFLSQPLTKKQPERDYAHEVADWLHEVAHLVCHDPDVDIEKMDEFATMFVFERALADELALIGLFTPAQRKAIYKSHLSWGVPAGIEHRSWAEVPPRKKTAVINYSRMTARAVGVLDEYFRPSWRYAQWTPELRKREAWPEKRGRG